MGGSYIAAEEKVAVASVSEMRAMWRCKFVHVLFQFLFYPVKLEAISPSSGKGWEEFEEGRRSCEIVV